MRLVFETTHPITMAGETFSGHVDIDDASKELVRAAGSAHAAGAITVTEGLDVDHVQSQEDAEQALAEAMGQWVPPTWREDGTREPGYWEGPWREGHVQQAAADDDHRENNRKKQLEEETA